MRPALVRRKEAQGKSDRQRLHHGGVQAVELVFELELVLGGQGLTTPVHQAKQGFKKRGGPPVIGVGKGGAGHRLRPQMVEVLEPGFQTGHAPAGWPEPLFG